MLRGRDTECDVLLELIRAARSGQSAVLAVQGEAGIGKTALLDYLVDAATGCRVLRAAGVESEMELAFAGLHQLCNPLLDGLDGLPAPQAEALGTAFGMRAGKPPDRFVIGLGVLTLLSEHAGDQPLICVIDDAQWLDQASAQILTFVARRLAAESVVMVFAARAREDEQAWAGLPRLMVHGLKQADAVAVLESVVTTPLDVRVRDRILAETRGNPLALLELPRWLSSAELTFGPDQTAAGTVAGRLEERFRRRLEPLPAETRRLLLIAAAEPLGDVGLLWRAAERLGLGEDAATPAEAADLIDVWDTVRFRHPLVRSAVYRSAALRDRQAAHRALAEATDPDRDPDRRAWHRAHAASGPDEAVAAELERSADRALAHGGLAAGAAFLARAARLTPDGVSRVERELKAAQTMLHAGAFDDALQLLGLLDHRSLTELQRARAEVLRAQIAFASNRGDEALPLLLAAARRLEPLDLELALDTYVTALEATLFAARRIGEAGAVEVAHAALSAPVPLRPRRSDQLLQCMAVLQVDGYAASTRLMRDVTEAYLEEHLPLEEGLRFLVLAGSMACDRWDLPGWTAIAERHLEYTREAGALNALQFALNSVVYPRLFRGDLATAGALLDEANALAEVAGTTLHPYGAIGLAAYRGDTGAEELITAAKTDATARGEGLVVVLTSWANAVIRNGNGDYPAALAHCREFLFPPGNDDGRPVFLPVGSQPGGWTLAELVEAATRCGEHSTAAAAAGLLAEIAAASGTDWALGIAARSAAQLHDAGPADDLFREAIDRLGQAGVGVEQARTRLLYGEWLRRAGRRSDARTQLRDAHDALTAMGVDAFAERARRELAATGETVRRRRADTRKELTAQELHIARLAADGRTNPEIGAELYLSRHTVEWHLRKVFAKLDVTSRRQLRSALERPVA
ncbi:helix-turn-helix transcriptional regulator [Jiangella mangrovi]|uniref:DNA-binding CsgD family transcriptional regulator n=1 Tax=Jiangella mangrovi TaxID=1524084 RepID=A0A7W9GVD2_9ACTN|nr:helix-turn-helix transcriptional regulator [Jiangella mangrovi]MBB5790356.1 DNA-binding CsgD family transcriptional regulator [Jiangella mangrovi]